MKKPDVTLTEINGNLRVTFVTPEAKILTINEPEIANYVVRKDNLVYLDILNNVTNKNNMILYCISINLKCVTE